MPTLQIVAVLRPMRASLSRPAALVGISCWFSPACRPDALAPRTNVITLRIHQSRAYSSPRSKKDGPPQPPLSWREVFAAIRRGMNFGPLLNAFTGPNLRRLYRQSPEELVLAIALLFGVSCIVLYVIYTYFTYFQSTQFTRYPQPIAQSLRKALYFSNYHPDNKLAIKHYKRALEQCEEFGLDTFSDDVTGIKIQLAAWLEKIGAYEKSIAVLETLSQDFNRWIEKAEEAVRAGQVTKEGLLIATESTEPEEKLPASGSESGGAEEKEEQPIENLWGKRRRILAKAVSVNVKLGDLYSDEHVLQGDKAQERLVWAVETGLRELQRRAAEGIREGEGEWLSPEQLGGALEALGNHYEKKSKHYLAAPLYLQAITLSPPKTCHTAVLMNNLAISLAQQPVARATTPSGTPAAAVSSASPAPPSRAALLASARSWALQAYSTSKAVEGEDRTAECDEACAVALCNLGEMAAMSGDMEEARRRFKDSLALSKRIGFAEGQSQAQEGLDAAASMPATRGSGSTTSTNAGKL